MSIKLSCDHFENSLFSISLSPRRDVAKKRLRSSNVKTTKNLNIVKKVTKFQIDNKNNNIKFKNNYNTQLHNDIISPQQNNIITEEVLNKKTISNTNDTAKIQLINNEDILIKTTTTNESNINFQCYLSIPKIISTDLSKNLNIKNTNIENIQKYQNKYNSNFDSNNKLVENEYKTDKKWQYFTDHHLNNEKNSLKLYNKNCNKFNNSINNNCSNINYKTDINNKDNINNNKESNIIYTIAEKYKHFSKFYSLNNNIVKYCIYYIVFLIFFNQVNIVRPSNALLIVDPITLNDGSYDLDHQFRSYSNVGLTSNINNSFINVSANNNGGNNSNNNGKSIRSSNNNNDEIENLNDAIVIGSVGSGGGGGGHYLDKLDNLERSVAAVLMKVAYGTTSTTKRSIPDNTYVPSLTTIATPPLTTLRYSEKSPHQQQLNLHHRNYELDLERDHALPTSAPNADILKSNSNPTYPNPNRHHNHDRDRHRHLINSTPAPSIHNLLNKGQPTISMYPGDMPSYSPPARAFFTPPLPPEYQNPFADKPTLRGTNNDGGIITPGTSNNQQSYINRRPIPPPSLMPGHERIPFRPPELNPGSSASSSVSSQNSNINSKLSSSEVSNNNGARGVSVNGSNGGMSYSTKTSDDNQQRKKTLNTPSQKVNNKIDPRNDLNNGNNESEITSVIQLSNGGATGTETNVNINGDRVPNISRILSGSNGKKEDIPEVLLKQVTSRPTDKFKDINFNGKSNNAENAGANINQSKDNRDGNLERPVSNGGSSILDESSEENDDDDFDDIFPSGGTIFGNKHKEIDEPKTQLTIKINGKSTENPHITSGSSASIGSNAAGANGVGSLQNSYSTQIIHNLANDKNFIHLTTSLPSGGNSHYQAAAAAKETKKTNGATSTAQSNAAATWDIAWNIHVYLSVILFTMLGVYSIFKMIFYNKLSHLFSQSYFVWIHLILISICVARIFYLIYDAYNIHSSFPIFISELLLNLPATFLTIAFSILILFLLIRSLNHKTNRYSALIRPLTVLVGSLVHVFLCVTLHLVESYTTTQNSHLHFYYQQQQQQQQQYRNTILNGGANGIRNFGTHHNGIPITIPPPPPRVLSLICQIIYIFVCLSLGLLYLYIYRILKRVLRSKSQNYIHGYQNLSYAIHITIATALLFVLLAALQIFGAISISTTRTINMTTGGSEVDWLQWGYQFSLRLIEIAIIWLMSWVAGLKTGGTPGVLQREKNIGGTSSGSSHDNHHNVSGFALFPCTSSSSQEHFETDYPAVCNANTNLHTYTLRTGKPIYDDNFALNSLQNSNNSGANNANQLGPGNGTSRLNDFHQQQQSHTDFVRSYETSSLRSGRHSANHSQIDSDFLSGGNNDSATDHYENPNFELRGSKLHYSTAGASNLDNCYSEPLNLTSGGSTNNRKIPYDQNYDFQNLERPNFQSERSHSRINEYNNSGTGVGGLNHKQKHNTSKLDRSSYENPERRSSNSTHSCANSRGGGVGGGVGGHYNSNNESNIRGYSQYNSFDRRNCGVRKSGTLNNIGSGVNATNTNHIHGRNGSSSSSTSSHSHHRPSGVQTLSSSHRSSNNSSGRMNSKGNSNFYRGSNSRNSLERINALNPGGPMVNGVSGTTGIIHNHTQLSQPQPQPSQQQQQQQQQQFVLPSDDEMLLIGNSQAERTNLINGHCSGNSSGNDVTGGITSSTSGGNLTDITTNGLIGNNEINSIKQQNFLNSNIGNSNNIINGNNNGGGANGGGGGSSSISGDSANSGSMLVAEHGFVRFRALDDINNAQGVGIHNASIRTTGRNKEKRYTNNT